MIMHSIYQVHFHFPFDELKSSRKSKAENEVKVIIRQRAISAVKNKFECFTYNFKENLYIF